MKRIIRIILAVFLLFIFAFGGLLLFSTLTNYSPEPGSTETLEIVGLPTANVENDTLTCLIWNIGYAGLGKEMDFFNDGGAGIRPDEQQAAAYLDGIIGFLKQQAANTDFILLQEVDRNSKRSYYTDQIKEISDALPGYAGSFALNYDVKFVPVPFGFPYTPYGKTYGGLQSLSRFPVQSATRLQYPGGFSWPTNLYMLDRCALEFRIPLKSGKELLLVNTHNTAYDASGEIKKQELQFMKERYEDFAKKGLAVLIGGDWNQVPPDWDSKHFSSEMPAGYTPQSLDKSLIPNGFRVAFDGRVATNRSNDKPFDPQNTYTTLIDYFMASSNVEILEVSGIDLGFNFSDHQPVRLKFVVKP
jgi:endonuclease/exonuclease/phosphatase family metal-dependent hydrolase